MDQAAYHICDQRQTIAKLKVDNQDIKNILHDLVEGQRSITKVLTQVVDNVGKSNQDPTKYGTGIFGSIQKIDNKLFHVQTTLSTVCPRLEEIEEELEAQHKDKLKDLTDQINKAEKKLGEISIAKWKLLGIIAASSGGLTGIIEIIKGLF
jgi:chromosome segregation ATPase